MAIDTHDYVRTALSALIDGLEPFVSRRFHELAPELSNWTALIEKKDRQAGRYSDRYNPKDVGLLLRALTENFGSLGYPFNGLLSRQASNCASELRTVRNRWAHNEEFTLPETYRALDSAEMLMRGVGADALADGLSLSKAEVIRAMGPATGAAQDTRTSEEGEPATDVEQDSSSALVVRALPVLSYALAHNSVPVLDEITVDYRGPELRGASIEVEVRSASGPLTDPKIVIADLDGESPTTIRNADVRLDPARMLSIDTPQPGSIHVTLRDPEGAVVLGSDHPVEVLSANQWVARPEQLGLEMLASFVQPNSPAIPSLLRDATDRLLDNTGRADLDGYQSGSPERVDAIVGAIYDSIAAGRPRYAEPPASWGMKGQKVRTPAEVLEGGLGTCMDTTLTLAAALEEAGINSTLWVVPGHIFLGYWRYPSSLDAPAELDASSALNLVGLGSIALVESTGMTTGMDFATARRAPHNDHLSEGAADITGVVDIQQSRLAQIYPLPSRTVDDQGEVHVHEYRVAAGRDALEYLPSAESMSGGSARALPPRVSRWKNTLLDLSLRNRLINFGDRSGYRLAVPQPSLPAFEDMINAGLPVTLLPSDLIPTFERALGIRWARDLPEAAR